MTVFPPRTAVLTGVLAIPAALALSACGGASDANTADGKNAATATTAEALGGVDALAEAAKKEGTLHAIALPRDWANYGALIDGFTKKYGIKVEVENPQGASQDEIKAVTSRKDQGNAPDVLDLGSSFAQSAAQDGLLAPYMVTGFADIPDVQRDSIGRWANDYGGYVSFGCDAKRVQTCPTSFKDLLQPQYKGKVALNGDPTTAGSAFGAVYAAALARGGSFEDIQPGIDFFTKLKKDGILTPVKSTAATIAKGRTPISIDWDYLNAGYTDALKSKGIDWKVTVPTDGKFSQYYSQAINKDAPHPAAARLWQEYLYSPEGQNLRLKGFARPALMDAMKKDGKLDKTAAAKLPKVSGTPNFPTETQQSNAKLAITQSWGGSASQ
ncbi:MULTISPECIES: ABC transporter substrate-binding protein [unclassified Streptomyces]|uniref:ABC transporter substrate-binding protein n=1 Tax=unclassified Streptomyces TaxID=2593676 RepID=UPI00088CBEB0|nr:MULTISPECIES: extracellular solute-binding protein [unclassified Streptomyces]PBC86305.1 putative spermidine/putrescine transport system substrate-binding protein [Streptomyces sp. 2321.6]SDQ89298.1 putative spermidine/putrescine transport system substrate-binding protein [Streptomyces sp. KS_16]SED72137.1 putative spermidine/putrescine transport system substrate-binding protein [Streptomyces sp. 2112.3]SED94281.1 putative spermidine/putrescine transport system substrate-binding protein [Str